jgi:hypothetical protein
VRVLARLLAAGLIPEVGVPPVDSSAYWKAELERLTRHLDQMKATPALALRASAVPGSSPHMLRRQLGDDLTHLRYGNTLAPRCGCSAGVPRRIASVEEVLVLKPELRRVDGAPAHLSFQPLHSLVATIAQTMGR